MISHNFRRQRRGSLCIRAYTASSDRCIAARVTRFPISFSSFPLIASFLEYHPDCESAWHLYIQFLSVCLHCHSWLSVRPPACRHQQLSRSKSRYLNVIGYKQWGLPYEQGCTT